MTDEEILNCDIEEIEKKTKGDDSQITPKIGEEDESEDDDDDELGYWNMPEEEETTVHYHYKEKE